MKPEISFIVPARNEEKALPDVLEGLARDLADHVYEVIIVDDASEKVLSREIKIAGPVQIWRNTERLGVAKSANIGARKASGEILIFLDAHVLLSKGWVKKLLAHKDLLPVSVLGAAIQPLYDLKTFSKMVYSKQADKIPAGEIYYGYQVDGFPDPVIRKNFKKESSGPFKVPYVSACSLIVSKELFLQIGGFEEEFTGFGSVQDLEFCMRAWALGYEVNVIPSITCYHCYYGDSLKGKNKDGTAHPLQSSKYDHSLENAVRAYYLHASEELFGLFLKRHETHREFKPNLDSLINEALKKRRILIDQKRKRPGEWVFERMGYAGAGNLDKKSIPFHFSDKVRSILKGIYR